MQTITIELPESVKNDLQFIKQNLQDLKTHFQPKQPTEFLTRQEVAELLSIDISSVNNWKNKGILKAHKIGGRVFYKRSEIESAMVELNK
ncbi:MAG: helix-turn-helix domain-containing protein [Aequorivita sp.]|nr:helix-turn-helix domain-containing protein [Aequorivita sp.]